MPQPYSTSMDEALAMLSANGPDLSNGLTNHAPLALEALYAMGRPNAVMPLSWRAAWDD